MSVPICYECNARPAVCLFEDGGPRLTGVAFCSTKCAASYALGMLRAGAMRWCYRCDQWMRSRAGACPQCGMSSQESAQWSQDKGRARK